MDTRVQSDLCAGYEYGCPLRFPHSGSAQPSYFIQRIQSSDPILAHYDTGVYPLASGCMAHNISLAAFHVCSISALFRADAGLGLIPNSAVFYSQLLQKRMRV